MWEFSATAAEICAAGVGGLITLGFLKSAVLKVDEMESAIVETFGKYSGTKLPGLRFKLPSPISKVVTRYDHRMQQADFTVEVRTKDGSPAEIPVSLHYSVINASDAYYKLRSPVKQMESFTLNVVTMKTATMSLAELCDAQNTLKVAIKDTLDHKIGSFGFEIDDVVVHTPKLSERIKQSFDEVIASERLKIAATNIAEADRIKKVAAAEAEREAMIKYGEGVAGQIEKIATGYEEAITKLEKANLSGEQAAVLIMSINGQEALVKASANPATVIISTTSGSAMTGELTDFAGKFAALRPKDEVQKPLRQSANAA